MILFFCWVALKVESEGGIFDLQFLSYRADQGYHELKASIMDGITR